MRTRLPLVSSVLDTIVGLEWTPIIVGGAIRDWIMGKEGSDFDVEIFGIDSVEHLEFVLKPLGKLELVGRLFGVLRYHSVDGNVDFALPRTDHKIGESHNEFRVTFDSSFSFETAARRRDFTVNALGMDWATGALLDPYNGQCDIRNGRLRHISDAFNEDPVRALRAAQLASRLHFTIDPDTIKRCETMRLDTLSPKHVHDEVMKLMTLSPQPSIGLNWLIKMGAHRQWTELGAWVSNTTYWHAGLEAIDTWAQTPHRDTSLTTALAVWLYSSQHIHEPLDIASTFLARVFDAKPPQSQILNLIGGCRRLVKHDLPSDTLLKKASCRLSLRQAGMVLSMIADHAHFGHYIFARASELGILDHAPIPLVTGKDLISIGIPEGPHLGGLINDFYNAQLEGKITSKESALALAKSLWD